MGVPFHSMPSPIDVAGLVVEEELASFEQPSLLSGLLWLWHEAAKLPPQCIPAAGKMRDMLVLLGAIAVGLPLMKRIGVASKVLGFLAIGIVIGPSGLALISDIHWSEMLAEVGIIFFLCEMGLELSFDRLSNMKRDVFVLGTAQFVLTTLAIFLPATTLLGLSNVQAIILGSAMSLSSSAFALQLLDETSERGTLHGRSAFGILLFQDLVVPLLLVLLPMLSSGGGPALIKAVQDAGVNALLALSPLFLGGRFLAGKIFSFVAEARSTVALRALSIFTVLGMCYLFQIFGLSSTLGAFVAGVLLSETAYREQVDAVISPIREDLLGLFFITVGFAIDLNLVLTRPLLVLSAMSALLLCKTVVTMGICRFSGLSFANSQHVGLLLCQAGEFSFVMFGIAQEVGIFSEDQAKLLLTVTAVSMACTPFLSRLGRNVSKCLQEAKENSNVLDHVDRAVKLREKVEGARVVVCGYGRVGRLMTQLLDARFVPWVAFDINPEVVAEAQSQDLPVFLGDLPELATKNWGDQAVGMNDERKVTVVTTANVQASTQIVQTMRQAYPEMRIIARATTKPYAKMLKQWGAVPIVPGLPEDTMLMNLPIGATVLETLGYSKEDAETVIGNIRLEYMAREDKAREAKGGLASLLSWYQGEQRSRLLEEELESHRHSGDETSELKNLLLEETQTPPKKPSKADEEEQRP